MLSKEAAPSILRDEMRGEQIAFENVFAIYPAPQALLFTPGSLLMRQSLLLVNCPFVLRFCSAIHLPVELSNAILRCA
jgi:hypothetical protein